MNGENRKGIFDDFTGKYSLSKTLRFELKPIGKTLENMRTQFGYDENLRTFLSDQNIEDAYQALKPIFDKIHEDFITESLESESVKSIKFSSYLDLYERKSDIKEKAFEVEEKKMRSAFGDAYIKVAESWKNVAGKTEKGKEIFSGSGFKILTEVGILEYIRKNADRFSDILSLDEIHKYLNIFEGFFTYFSGFNQNRENYYVTRDEKATAVATRIVHENLPIFCDNVLIFRGRQRVYEDIFESLRKLGDPLVMKGKDKKETPCISIDPNLFRIEYFTECLSQTEIESYNEAVGNANFLINRYNQAHGEKSEKLKFFKTLYRQIGCGRRDALFFELTDEKKSEAEKKRANQSKKKFYSLEELLHDVSEAGGRYFRASDRGDVSDIDVASLGSLPDLIAYIRSRENFTGFYWSKAAMNTISNRYFSDWHSLKDRLKTAKVFQDSVKGSQEDVRIPEAIDLEDFFTVLDSKPESLEEEWHWRDSGVFFKESLTETIECERKEDIDYEQCERRKKRNERYSSIVQNAQKPSRALLEMILSDIGEHVESFVRESGNIAHLSEYTSETSKEAIKSWLDEMLSATQMIKYFVVRPSKIKGEALDSVLAEYLKVFLDSEKDETNWFRYYDATRNFLTKKPQDDAKKNKLKLNFGQSTLASGWDMNKESDNLCVIFRDRDEKYFLGIISKRKEKGYNSLFKKQKENKLYVVEKGEIFSKMEYKLLPGPNKMLPKCLLPKSNRKKYGATDEILKIYDHGDFKKGSDGFSRESLGKIIDFYKSGLQKYEEWNCFDFSFRPTEEYVDISQFYLDVEKQGYKNSFVSVNKTVVDSWVSEGKLYLFEIHNQDSNSGKKEGHKNNLHTMYWDAMFRDIENRPKLNGEAEVFYRSALPEEKQQRADDNSGKSIIKNFRFSKEKFLFHVPITLNFCMKDRAVNREISEKLRDGAQCIFLGIDRGEKHLAYWSLVNEKGELLDQGSFNVVGGKDYNALLEARAGERDFARKNWKTIGTIKDLKEGYISQVVRKIVDIAVEKGALIVLEDLNIGFKRGRQKIEKQVYQKLELALAKKLNFLVDKSVKIGEIGSVTKAFQLTPPVNNFGDINSKQFGIMLYTRANYTSQTDPLTGWRKTVYLKRGSEESIKREILETFSDIVFDGKDYAFTYVEKIKVRIEKGKKKENNREIRNGKTWTLYSGKNGESLDRFRGKRGTDKNEWKVEKEDVVEMLDSLFANLDKKDKNRSLLTQIKEDGELVKISEYPAYESLRYCIDLIQQIRNAGEKESERDSDFLLSPVRDDRTGEHFDSRKYWDVEQRDEKPALPSSGDSNGAYNIARKGIVMAEHIHLGYKTYISDEEWSAWLSGESSWRKWIEENEKDLKWKEKK